MKHTGCAVEIQCVVTGTRSLTLGTHTRDAAGGMGGTWRENLRRIPGRGRCVPIQIFSRLFSVRIRPSTSSLSSPGNENRQPNKKNKSGPNRITKIDRRISLVWMYQSHQPRIAGSHQCGRFNDRFFSVFRRTTAVDQENQIAGHAIPPILVDDRVLSGRQPAFE
jgi:hypothetical protein